MGGRRRAGICGRASRHGRRGAAQRIRARRSEEAFAAIAGTLARIGPSDLHRRAGSSFARSVARAFALSARSPGVIQRPEPSRSRDRDCEAKMRRVWHLIALLLAVVIAILWLRAVAS
jgi:hypothetical protein